MRNAHDLRAISGDRYFTFIAMSAVTFVRGGSPINPDLKRVSVPYTLHPTPYTLRVALYSRIKGYGGRKIAPLLLL
jgi:hypothetical protein